MYNTSTTLRNRAEAQLRISRQDIVNMPMGNIQKLVHELQIHQVELQMQNEELQQTQAELEASRDKYLELYDFAPIGYLTLDADSKILEANLIAATQLNISREKLIGLKFSKFIAPSSQKIFYLHNRNRVDSHGPQLCEIELASPHSGITHIQIHSVESKRKKGQCQVAISDISAHKQLLELTIARNKAEAANHAKSQFLANISHEIRTPLNAIMGLGYILSQDKTLSTKQKEQLDILQSSAESLLHLINELLDISKIEACGIALEYASFDFSALLHDVLNMLSGKVQEKKIELIKENHLTHSIYWGDAQRIRQVIINLVSNAIKFTEKGTVTVHVTTIEKEGRPNIMFSVNDTGIGIPHIKQPHIFDAFVQVDASMTRRYGGSGLGLAICKQLVTHMGGDISVQSIEGKGSTFTVILPLHVSHETTHSVFPPLEINLHPSAASLVENPTILLVEDYAANIVIATTFLKAFSCNVDIASDGKQALQKVQEHHYDLIIMDVQMQHMDEYEATRLIRQMEQYHNRPPTPIIAMTAHALPGDKEKCLAAGMSDYISKPFNPNELRQKLEHHLLEAA